MTTDSLLPMPGGEQSPPRSPSLPRLAIIDRHSGCIQVLSKRLDRVGWEHRVLGAAPPLDQIVSMRLGAVIVDLSILGPQAWEWLDRVSGAVPGLAIVVCTAPSTVAQRV